MGFVWNVLLAFDDEEWWEEGAKAPRDTCVPLQQINRWLPHGQLVSLTEPTYATGAGHGMDANLFGGGFKHFDLDSFVKVVKAQRWKEPTRVQLWVKGGEEGLGGEVFTQVPLRAQAKKRASTDRRR